MKNFFRKILNLPWAIAKWFEEIFSPTVEVEPGVRKPKKEWSKEETFYVAELRAEGVTRKVLREQVRELRAHGCKVWLMDFPGRWYRGPDGKLMALITNKGKAIFIS